MLKYQWLDKDITNSQFLGGYLRIVSRTKLAKVYASQFLGGYLLGSTLNKAVGDVLALNSLADT